MARVARKRRDGLLGTGLREAFAELGVDYRPTIARTTPAKLREQYLFRLPSGEQMLAEEHIALGATRDPRRCLRICFSSRAPNEERFVYRPCRTAFQSDHRYVRAERSSQLQTPAVRQQGSCGWPMSRA